jgi:hypothetical protein
MIPLLLTLLGCSGTAGGDEGLALHADPHEGPLPLTVLFSATGENADEAVWDFGDGVTLSGAEVTHTYLASGDYTVTVRRSDNDELKGSGPIHVDPGVCPEEETGLVTGTVSAGAINEASGLVASRMNPGVLWTHNDSGDSPRFFAIDEAGELLAIVNLFDVSRGDWEDMALTQDLETGAWQLVAGNVGDNDHDRDDVHIHIVDEPVVTVGQPFEEHDVEALTFHVTYPDGQMFDCETVMVDPVTQDLYLVTKDYDGPSGVYRKSPPHVQESTTELVLVKQLDFSQSPLSGNATTGGGFSPLGDRVVVRTYGTRVYVWLRDQADPVEQLWDSEPCSLRMPGEQQSESIDFATDGQGLWSLSEGESQPIHFVALF